jgi:hypothetical protein
MEKGSRECVYVHVSVLSVPLFAARTEVRLWAEAPAAKASERSFLRCIVQRVSEVDVGVWFLGGKQKRM